MSREWRAEVDSSPWGPFVGRDYKSDTITYTDITISCVVWALTLVNLLIASWLGYKQCHSSRSPLKSVYIWMIWLEMGASFTMGLECFLFVLKYIRPSIYFYCTVCIGDVVYTDRNLSRRIMIATAVIVTAINISVFCIWVPARIQVNHTYIVVNEIWDRIEKFIYLIMDSGLNWYFLKVVKANLVNNGLQKYNKLLRFNQRIIILSLLMDVMIIAAMSIPNSFIYILFHPLAYLVKLNIEMTMANLIKRIAVSSSRKAGGDRARIANEFDFSNPSTSGQKSSTLHRTHARRSSLMELSNFGLKSASEREVTTQGVSFIHATDQIKVTKDIYIQSETMKSDLLGPAKENMQVERPEPGEISVVRSKSVDDLTEGGSVKSNYIQGKGDSDDETHLVSHQGKGPWYRLE